MSGGYNNVVQDRHTNHPSVMSPLKKRAKHANGKDDTENGVATASTSVAPSVDELNTFFDSLTTQVLPNSDNEAIFSSLLQLKAWQYSLLEGLQASEKELEEAHSNRIKEERSVAALEYERRHLDSELETCRNFEMKHLKQLASEETGEESITEGQLAQFLNANLHDPSDREKVKARLHGEINHRGKLENELKMKKEKLESLEKELKEQSSFFDSLPDHLASLERASQPLQRFMRTKLPSGQSNNSTIHMIGSDRYQRIEQAQSLSPPLYTLFQQLQHYLDQPAVDDEDADSNGTNNMSLSIASNADGTDSHVVLQLSVPDLSSSNGKNKRVSICFHFDQASRQVTAFARGCTNTLNQDILLNHLFPGDCPEAQSGDSGSGLPYHWCNYLAGVHVVPGRPGVRILTNEKTLKQKSTRVIVRELQRRVRANATLKHILYSLKRSHVPAPPGSDTSDIAKTCKLLKFNPDKEDENKPESRFEVVLGKGNTKYKTSVSLNMATYPSETPQWTLLEQPQDGNQLYDDRLASLENYVNSSGLMELVESIPTASQNDETAYEWILVLQLRYILEFLGGGGSSGEGTRKVKGRDHSKPVAA